jgi:hypothetical protein
MPGWPAYPETPEAAVTLQRSVDTPGVTLQVTLTHPGTPVRQQRITVALTSDQFVDVMTGLAGVRAERALVTSLVFGPAPVDVPR